MLRHLVLIALALAITSCSSDTCTQEQATNKMLALGRVSARVAAQGGQYESAVAARIGIETGEVSELIAQGKYGEACTKADEIAKKLKVNLADEEKNMLTIEQLAKDGGKGSGTCSISDAAKRQMELHSLLQAEVMAGRKDSEVFNQFTKDTASFGEKLTRNPSEACALIDELKTKYGLP
ncbi:MAG: hypothetical protein J5J00_06420 [Deltaproteobacteria bacterium]|nr:hypothetical protein [Deltaproteobacteria bacterium]